VVGSGGREHTLVWKLAQSPRTGRIICAPGNAGIAQQAECVSVSVGDLQGLADLAVREKIDLTVVGPEAPLAGGIVDVFQQRGLRIFGPTRAAAVLESSKAWSKDLLSRYNIPTGYFATFDRPEDAIEYVGMQELPVVVKADGLAAGKGVTVARTRPEAEEAIKDCLVRGVFGESGRRVVVEQYLDGEEMSVMALVDGERLYPMPASQDHKQIYDGDQGPNTGGMGAFSPVPIFPEALYDEVLEAVMRPTVRAMAEEGRPISGCLYAGLMLTDEGPKVLEFNCRFGDPESQVVLPLLDADLVELLEAAADGRLPAAGDGRAGRGAAVCVVMASGGYPGEYETGKLIQGLDSAAGMSDVVVFHAATKKTDEGLVTTGGRVLGVTGLADSLPGAIAAAYRGVSAISFDGAHWRTDIGSRRREKAR